MVKYTNIKLKTIVWTEDVVDNLVKLYLNENESIVKFCKLSKFCIDL